MAVLSGQQASQSLSVTVGSVTTSKQSMLTVDFIFTLPIIFTYYLFCNINDKAFLFDYFAFF